jgi:hypothetical protein
MYIYIYMSSYCYTIHHIFLNKKNRKFCLLFLQLGYPVSPLMPYSSMHQCETYLFSVASTERRVIVGVFYKSVVRPRKKEKYKNPLLSLPYNCRYNSRYERDDGKCGLIFLFILRSPLFVVLQYLRLSYGGT